MEKISEMIKRLCPEGVHLVRLDNVCSFNRGRTITAKNAGEGEIPVIAGGQTPSYYHNVANRKGESVVVAGSGAYAGFVSYWNIPIYVSDAFSVEPNEHLHKKYLFFYLKHNQQKLFDMQKGAGVPHVHGKDIAGLEIPLPPLPIQQEIVRILDSFTSMITNLETELASRQKQYEYYRNKLLTFDENDESVEWKTLGEVSLYSKERINAKELDKSNYVSVENLLQNKSGKINSTCCPSEGNWVKYVCGDILIGNIRPNLRKIWLADIEGGTNGDVLVVHLIDSFQNSIISKYLYYILSSEEFFIYDIQNAKGAKMPRGDKGAVMRFPIAYPSPQRQQKIVSTLDTFESLITNLKQEIAARKKQYEYYREQLLTFEK